MAQMVREVMTGNPVCLDSNATLMEAANNMRERDIGDVLITDHGQVSGLLTDRDVVVRAIADGLDPRSTTVDEVASHDLVTLTPDDSVGKAVELMREYAVRRLPVCENGHPVGVVSIGDLALEEDPLSALADISGAPANR